MSEAMENGAAEEQDEAEASVEAEEEQTEAMLEKTQAQDFCLESITAGFSY